MNDSLLIIGCGYLGSRVAEGRRARGGRVIALTRGRAEQLRQSGIEPIVGDVLDPASLTKLPQADTVLYAVGLDRSVGRSMREVYVEGLRNVLRALPTPRRFLYISSTSVYGQTDGSFVNEDSPTEPLDESGKIVLEAEGVLRAGLADAIILRFAGIYGPNRILRRDALLAGEPLVGDAEKWLNLIHVADGASAVELCAARAEPGSRWLVADGTPVRRRDFYTESARLLGGPPAAFASIPPGVEPPRGERVNRRIDSARLRERLGFVPRFRDYRSGLTAALAEESGSSIA